jgi:hypothetical protein
MEKMENPGKHQEKKIIELTEIYDEQAGQGRRPGNGKMSPQTIVIDGRGYDQAKSNQDRIHDLTEIIEDQDFKSQINDMVIRRADEIIERIARDMIPGIAERVIREEIEKIKAGSTNRPLKQD